MPSRGPKLFFFSGRTGSSPGYSSSCVCRLKTADLSVDLV